jgi:hypothetical protein
MHGTSSRQLELMPAVEHREIWHSLNESQRRELLDLLARLLLHGLQPVSAAATCVAAEATASARPTLNPGEFA